MHNATTTKNNRGGFKDLNTKVQRDARALRHSDFVIWRDFDSIFAGGRSGAYERQRDAAGHPAALRFGVDGGRRPDAAQCDAPR